MQRMWIAWVGALALLGTGLAWRSGMAGIIPEAEEHMGARAGWEGASLEARLGDPDRAEAALGAVLRSADALKQLEEVVVMGTDLSARGRALLAIRDLPGDGSDAVLERVITGGHPTLVGSWAAAAQIYRADDVEELTQLTSRFGGTAGVERPIELKAKQLLASASTADVLLLIASQPHLTGAVSDRLQKEPVLDLVALMQTHKEDNVRRQAAAWLATRAGTEEGRSEVSRAVRRSLAWSHGAKMPWTGGALYVPGIAWQAEDAADLVRTLIQWNLHCEKVGKPDEQRQVQNNLRSVQLLQAAGFKNAWPDVNGPEVLKEYAGITSERAARSLLEAQGLTDSRWAWK